MESEDTYAPYLACPQCQQEHTQGFVFLTGLPHRITIDIERVLECDGYCTLGHRFVLRRPLTPGEAAHDAKGGHY